MKPVVFVKSLFCLYILFAAGARADEPCRIKIVDAENGWPVPLVTLTTTHNVRFVSDNAGLIAFDLPELMGVETWFKLDGHGYTLKPDGFGMIGFRFVPEPGKTKTVEVKRAMVAKRLGRITGAGLFAESQKLGEERNWKEQRVLGCDSVQNAVHNGRLVWAWGDTVLAHYPLGRFHMIGATTSLQPLDSFKPPIRLRYDYIVDKKGVPRNTARIKGEGPTWLSGYVSLPDRAGKQVLVATYSKIKPPLTEYEVGLCRWNEADGKFEKQKLVWNSSVGKTKKPVVPVGHPVFVTDSKKQRWVLFGDPFPHLKCKAEFEEWSDPSRWIALEPQKMVLSRERKKQVKPHRGAIAWNEYRKKWVSVFTEENGDSSILGEIWYAEAERPEGPWMNAVKIVTHNEYSFYNPQLHPRFTPKGSPILLFEATYTKTFSKSKSPTPRYDYNQVLYRLDLDQIDFGTN